MHRELPFQSSKLAAPIVLQGRTVRKSTAENSTLGRWNNLIEKSKSTERVRSPNSVANRTRDFKQAGRTIQPELNENEVRHKTRKINATPGPEDPGNITHLLRRTGTIDTIYNGTKKKQFRELHQTEDQRPAKTERRVVKPHEKKTEDWCSHIPGMSSPTRGGRREDSVNNSFAGSPRRALESNKKRVDHLKSAIALLPTSDETRRPYQDKDELKIMQSVHSPRLARHLESTFQHQPLFRSSSKVDPNRTYNTSYEDTGKLHPHTKGKKTSYPQYVEKNTSDILNQHKAGTATFSARYGGVEPLDALFVGRRNIRKQSATNNIFNSPEQSINQRGSTVFSYRTYASQVTF